MACKETRRRRFWLGLSLVSNLTVLGFFKYFNFFAASFSEFSSALGWQASPVTLQIILPVGISFFTFQALSYVIDVYRRDLPAVRDPIEYFAFIAFFPHMVAGPIQQAKHFLVQFHRDRQFNWEQSSDGARQMLWGFFKKMVIADNLAIFVNNTYGNIEQASGWMLFWATYAFAIQIYCDFSGYTDIAIGCARLFDLHMTRNFAYPYLSRSIPEFWRRWHISLSNWFRDYVYIPLGGNRVSPLRHKANIVIVFLLSGLWHGANWTFIIWGFLHGLFFLLPWKKGAERSAPADSAHSASADYASSVALPTLAPASWRDLPMIFLTFNLTCLLWVFFRAPDVTQALAVLQKIGIAMVSQPLGFSGERRVALCLIVLLAVEWFSLSHHRAHPLQIPHWPRPWRWAAYYVLALLIWVRFPLSYEPFIYFQF
jgi:D-alanyl-lipoteichoic acid acyltransferase DltB (MBOAT superfamily)